MANQLLWLETLLKVLAGLPLMVAPIATAKLLGLPAPSAPLWPRLLGALLVGVGLAAYIQGSTVTGKGLGFVGAIVINLLAAGVIAALLVLDRAAQTTRGRSVLWVTVVILVLLSLLELAQV